jgi:hypothetical protein
MNPRMRLVLIVASSVITGAAAVITGSLLTVAFFLGSCIAGAFLAPPPAGRMDADQRDEERARIAPEDA